MQMFQQQHLNQMQQLQQLQNAYQQQQVQLNSGNQHLQQRQDRRDSAVSASSAAYASGVHKLSNATANKQLESSTGGVSDPRIKEAMGAEQSAALINSEGLLLSP